MRRAALPAVLLLAACGHGTPKYRHFSDVPYGFGAPQRVWSPRAQLNLHIEVMGPARSSEVPLVLLHPWGLNMTVWADVAPALAQTRRVLLVDLPGHGKSDKPNAPYPMRRLAAAVLDAMDAAGFERAVVMGNSLGGATSLAVAELAPERVHKLVLVAAPGGDILPAPIRRAAHGIANEAWLQSLSDEGWFIGVVAVERSLSKTAARLRDDLIALRRSEEWPAWCRATIRILREVAAYSPELERLKMPALVVHGTGDLLITEGLNRSLSERLPRGRMAVLEGCGHVPEIECPQALLGPVQAFVAEDGPAGVTESAQSGHPNG